MKNRMLVSSVLAAAVLALSITSSNESSGTAQPSPYGPVSDYLDISPARSSDLGHPYFRGKVVVVSTADHQPEYPDPLEPRTIDDTWDGGYAPELHPQSPDEVGTIVWEDCTAVPAGTYTNGADAYGVACLVTIIDKVDDLIVGEQSFSAEAPLTTTSDKYGMAAPPLDQIERYLLELPRRSLTGEPVATPTNALGPGLPWTEQRKLRGSTGVFFQDIVFADASHGWVVTSSDVYSTTDGGATWTDQPAFTGVVTVSGAAFTDAAHGWAVGADGAVAATTDGGATWTTQPSRITGAQLNDAVFPDAKHGWAVGDITLTQGGRSQPVVVATSNGGASWKRQELPTVANKGLFGVAFTDDRHGWAVGGNGGSGKSSVILATTDGGATWKVQAEADQDPTLLDVVFDDARHGWAVGYDGTILATTDGGKHWNRQRSGTSWTLNAVAFSDPKHGWAVGEHGTIRATTDGGKHWKRQKSTGTEELSSVTFLDTKRGWAVGENATLLATTNGGTPKKH